MKNARRLKLHTDKQNNLKFLVIYTVLFAIAALSVFGYFFFEKYTFITPGDGYKQHFKAFVYFGMYCREIIRTLINEHSLVIPQWSYSIGYGGDIFTTLHYYTIGDPLDLLSVFVPVKYSIYAYTLITLLRYYLSGLCFALYCKYRKVGSNMAIAAGGLVYTFTTYSLFVAFVHPFFMNPVIYLPLILLAVEKIFNGKCPYLLTVMVFISAVSNFYFFYMLVLVTVIYVIFRMFFIYGKGDVKKAFLTLFKIGVSSVIGLVMSAAILVPVIMVFMGDSRTGDAVEVGLLYPLFHYKNFLQSFVTSSYNMSNMTCFGLSSVSLLALFMLFIRRRENKEVKILFVIATLSLMFPVVGYVFNGFSYIANRWMWAYFMIVAYVLVIMWDKLKNISIKESAILVVLLGVYSVAAFALIKQFDKNLVISLVIALACIILLMVTSKLGFKKVSNCGVALLIILSLSVNSYFNCMDGNVNRDNYYSFGKITKTITDTPGTEVKKSVDDDSFYRYSGSHLVVNSDLVNSTKGTSFYWSLQNNNIAQFMEEMNMPYRYLYQYFNLDNRASLNSLAAVKYYVSDDDNNKPYGFEKISDDIYENSNALPLGYTYSSYITREEYDKYSAVEKQQAILQGVLLEEDLPDYSKANVTLTDKEIEYTITTDSKCNYKDGKLTVNEGNAQFTLHFNGLENSETYLSFVLNDYTSENESGSYKFTVSGATEKGNGAKNTYTFNSKYSIRYDNRNQLLFNAGYSKEAKKSITVTVSAKGVYDIPEMKVICQPVDEISSQVSALKTDTLENVKVYNDVIKGTIDLEENKILCLSVPFSDGWTAYVDGKETKLYQANTMYMALPLTAGEHDIKLVYTTPYLKAGICLSALGIVAFAGYIIVNEKFLKKKRYIDESR